MFAEVSLQGAIVQRVRRYDDTIRFYLNTRRAPDGVADDPAQTHLIDVPMGVTRALPIGRLTVGMNIYVQARLIHGSTARPPRLLHDHAADQRDAVAAAAIATGHAGRGPGQADRT